MGKKKPVVPAVQPNRNAFEVSGSSPTSAQEPVLTPEELAAKLKLPSSTIYQLTRKRSGGRPPMPKLKAGKFLRFHFSEVVRWMAENGKAA